MLVEMFEDDSANTCTRKFLLMSMGGRADGLACADPGALTPIGVSVNWYYFLTLVPVVKIPEGAVVGLLIFVWAILEFNFFYPPHYHIFWGKRGVNSKIVLGL